MSDRRPYTIPYSGSASRTAEEGYAPSSQPAPSRTYGGDGGGSSGYSAPTSPTAPAPPSDMGSISHLQPGDARQGGSGTGHSVQLPHPRFAGSIPTGTSSITTDQLMSPSLQVSSDYREKRILEEIGEEALAQWKAYEKREIEEGNFTCPAEEKQEQEARDGQNAVTAGGEQLGEHQASHGGVANADNANKQQNRGPSGSALSMDGAHDDHRQHQHEGKGKGRASNDNANKHNDDSPFGPGLSMDGAYDDPRQYQGKGKGRACNDNEVFCVNCHNFMRQRGYKPDFCEYCEENPGCDVCHSDLRRNSARTHGQTQRQSTHRLNSVPARLRAAPAATVVVDAPVLAAPAAPAAGAGARFAAAAGRAPATSSGPVPATRYRAPARAGPSSRTARAAADAERTVPQRHYDRVVRLIADQQRRMIRLNAHMQTAFIILTYRIQAILYRPDASLFFDLPSINAIVAELTNLFAVSRRQENQFINVFDGTQRSASNNAMHIETLENLWNNASRLERRIVAMEMGYFYRHAYGAYGVPASDPGNGDNTNGNVNNGGDDTGNADNSDIGQCAKGLSRQEMLLNIAQLITIKNCASENVQARVNA